MPAPDSVGANEKWLIVIEVRGKLDSDSTSALNQAIHNAVKTQSKAKVTFSNTGPATA
jgi:hypothetical protein